MANKQLNELNLARDLGTLGQNFALKFIDNGASYALYVEDLGQDPTQPALASQILATGIPVTAAGGGDVVGPTSSTDNAVVRFDGITGKLIQDSAVTLGDTGIFAFPDDIRQTFNPGATTPGFNPGSNAGDPSTPANGDIWYDSTGNLLRARINGATVSLGAGGTPGGSTTQLQYNNAGAFGGISNFLFVTPQIRINTPVTADALADFIVTASATTQKGLVVQAKATPTAAPFVVQQSDGVEFFRVGPDGNCVVSQRTGGIANIFLVSYLGTTKFTVDFNGDCVAARDMKSVQDVVAARNSTYIHSLGTGTSPTVADNGDNASTIAGKDAFCKVTVGTGAVTQITITFGTAYATAPVVNVNGGTSTAIRVTTTTTTAVLIHPVAFTGGEVLLVASGGF